MRTLGSGSLASERRGTSRLNKLTKILEDCVDSMGFEALGFWIGSRERHVSITVLRTIELESVKNSYRTHITSEILIFPYIIPNTSTVTARTLGKECESPFSMISSINSENFPSVISVALVSEISLTAVITCKKTLESTRARYTRAEIIPPKGTPSILPIAPAAKINPASPPARTPSTIAPSHPITSAPEPLSQQPRALVSENRVLLDIFPLLGEGGMIGG
mmetsp:Transcript_23023/g.36176  ORF Transcript_23023/g.36176 Transcript_23023/m.36176 type:complete len:221 (-) Transcript_23023:78-740(-)